MTPARRVAARWRAANVVPFPKKPRGPQVLIGGRRYALSDYWPMGTAGDDDAAVAGGRLIDVGGNKFRWLWVYDTDKQVVAMWRYSDGDEKHYDRSHSVAHHIHKLEQRGQLNRVAHDEFRVVEREMRRRQEDTIVALKQWAKEMEDANQKRVNEIARTLFEREYRPRIERALAEVERGVVPLGFKMRDIPRDRAHQLRTHVVSQILQSQFTERAVEDAMRAEGLDPDAEDMDIQAAYWAVNDVREEAYEEFLR